MQIKGGPLKDQRVFFCGAGSAGIGISDIIIETMVDEGYPLSAHPSVGRSPSLGTSHDAVQATPSEGIIGWIGMLLYQFRKGTNPRRVIIYLSEKGLDVPRHELDYVNGEHRTPGYLRINPAGRAPALVTDDGGSLTEAAAIVEYLEELHPSNPMIGTDPLSRARVRALERLGNDLCVRSQAWLWNLTDAFRVKEPHPSREFADRAYRYVAEILDVLEALIGDNEYMAGEHPTIADFTAFAIFQTARERFDQPLGANHPSLDAWYRNFRRRPSADY